MSPSAPGKAAYFDVDGTIVGSNLLYPTLHYLMNQASPLDSARRLAGLALQAPLLLAAEMKDRRRFNEQLFYHFKGMSQDRLICLAQEVFEDVFEPRIFRGTQGLLDKCRDAGMRIVFVTGALDLSVTPLAEHLGADAVIANRLELKDGIATGRLLRPVVAGPSKARLVVEDARLHGHDLAECHAYSDSLSDVPMMSVVGHPFCVNPDGGLRDLARSYDWPVLDLDKEAPGNRTRLRLPFGFYAN
jgi:HAD superfamily hydrolase (TIGR01490 family)